MYRYVCDTQYVNEHGSFIGNHIYVQKDIKNNKWVTMTQYQCILCDDMDEDVIVKEPKVRTGVVLNNLLFDLDLKIDEDTMFALILQGDYTSDNFIEYEEDYFYIGNGIIVCKNKDEFKIFKSHLS